MNQWIVTANRLSDGGVAYQTEDLRWSHELQRAWRGEASAAELRLARARRDEHVICDPYVLEVGAAEGGLTPLTARERIRAEGPLPTLRRLGLGALIEPPKRAVG